MLSKAVYEPHPRRRFEAFVDIYLDIFFIKILAYFFKKNGLLFYSTSGKKKL